MRVVCNTSPPILLAKIARLDLLSQLYDEVIIPASVLEEIKAKPEKEAEWVHALSQKFHVPQATNQILEGFPADFGPGEREAIALALGTGADLVILDDQRGRWIAREKGLSVTGTVGVLI